MNIEVEGQLEGHPVRATWIDGELSGDAPLVATIVGMVAGGARVSMPGVVAGEATIDGDPTVWGEHAMISATLSCACDVRPYPRLGGDPAPPSPAPFDPAVDY
jgi:hypothetical protein